MTTPPPTIAPRPQLLTYPDSLGGTIEDLRRLLSEPLAGLFQGVHILPPFPSTADRGFAPVTYDTIDPAFGMWSDITELAATHDVLLDVMVNHISRQSPEFLDFQQHGRRSRFADLFITVDKIWTDGDPPADDLAKIHLRKPDSPFSTIDIGDGGQSEQVWTSFGTANWSEQVDLDITTPAARKLITDWLRTLAGHGVRIVRLDAVGYVIKRAGTTCFMVEPDIYEFLDWIEAVAASLGVVLLPEVHDHYETHRRLADRGHWTYDFVLPALLLEAFHSGRAGLLAAHLAQSPSKQFTTLDCHDGIPVRPDLDGLLPAADLRSLAERTVARGGNINHVLTTLEPGDVDVHQLNCTYYAALGRDDDRYLAARAIQLFARGVPQIYYVGLLAGDNDHAAVERAGDGRAINRHDYTLAEITRELERPVVQRLADLIALRNTHPAFDGALQVGGTRATLSMTWTHQHASCSLTVDLASGRLDITASHL